MNKLRTLWDNFEENLLIFILFVALCIIFLQVVMRYVFQNSLSWSEEIGRYLFIWLTWLGTGYAVRQKRHLRIEMLSDLFSERGKLLLDILAMSIWCGFTIFLVMKGSAVTSMIWRRGQYTPALEIPMALAYASVPVGASLMCLRLLDEIRRSAGRLLKLPQEGGDA